MNFLVQVKVISRLLAARDLTQMREIPGIKSSDFTEIYGDSYISGFIEGGEFAALFSITVDSERDVPAVRSAFELSFHEFQKGKPTAGLYDFQKLIDDDVARVSIRYIFIFIF